MPMPTPRAGEDRQDFLSRCIGNADVRDVARRNAGADAEPSEVNRIAAGICGSQARRGENALSDDEAKELAGGVDLEEFAALVDEFEKAQLPEHREHGMDLKGVEIFRAGTWNGDKYTEQDLDDMVTAFDGVGYRPPVKLGHSDEVGGPAYGWVDAIRRVGDRLVADFSDLPDEIYEAITNRRYDSVSAEIFFNLKRGTQKFRRALKAVALLGAEIPGVAGLAPLRDSLAGLTATAHSYTIDIEDLEMPNDEAQDLQKQIEAAKAELDELKRDGQPSDPPPRGPGSLEIRRLQEQLDAVQAQLAEARKAREKAEAVAKAAQTREPELQAKIVELQEAQRQERIDRKIEEVSIPALRGHFHLLYDLATANAEKAVHFTFADGKNTEIETTAEEVVDDLRRRINSQASRLFQELGRSAPDRENADSEIDDPGAQLDRLTRVHMSRHQVDDYMAALRAVRNDPDNADLVRAYDMRGN